MELKQVLFLCCTGEGDAFGNLNLTAQSGVHKSAVMLRCSCCVDIHILDVKDLKEVLVMFPQFSKKLKKKMSTILRKTVLTSQVATCIFISCFYTELPILLYFNLQILSSWDAIEVEEACSEQPSLHFFTTWLGRQKAKRDCNVQDHQNSFAQRKKKGGINETLVTLPLCVLSSTCGSSDDVQKLWRFANIIENSKEEHINGILHGKNHLTKVSDKPNEDAITEESCNFELNNPQYQSSNVQCRHRRSKHINIKQECDEELVEQESSESEESTTHHSRNCELHEKNLEKHNEETNYRQLEANVHLMNKKLQVLETKMDKILSLLEQQDPQRKA
jgi:hypothetical protein